MSGVCVQSDHLSGVWVHSKNDPKFLSLLKQYWQLLLSVYGPKGGGVLIQNSAGREVLASSSSLLLQELQFSHPCLKFINALVTAQNKSYNLYGLYTGVLCSELLSRALQLEEEINHEIVIDVSEWIIEEFLTNISHAPKEIVLRVDIGNLNHLLIFVQTILKSKATYSLLSNEVEHLNLQIVQAFVKTVPDEQSINEFGHVHITTAEGPSTLDAEVLDGVLIREPDFCFKQFRNKQFHFTKDIKILIFNVPLSFEDDETQKVLWLGGGYRNDKFADFLLVKLRKYLKKNHISIVANQKVIHPVVKFELERDGYLVLERLGTVPTNSLIQICGCKPISKISDIETEIESNIHGNLTHVHHINRWEKDYILLGNNKGRDVTLLLPGINPPTISILEEAVDSCLGALRLLAQDPRCIVGGGCLETWAAALITKLLSQHASEFGTLINTSPTSIYKVGNIFSNVLIDLALQVNGGTRASLADWGYDTFFQHMWNSQQSLIMNDSSNTARKSPKDLMSESNEHNLGSVIEDDSVIHLPSEPNCEERQILSSLLSSVDFKSGYQDKQSTSCDENIGMWCSCGGLSAEMVYNDSGGDWSPLLNYSECHFENNISTLSEHIYSSKKESMNVQVEDCFKTTRFGDSTGSFSKQIYEHTEKNAKDIHKNELKITLQNNSVIDSYPAKFNAMRLAFEGFSQLLKVGQYIFDK